MNMQANLRCTAFEGPRLIAAGELAEVALAAKAVIDLGGTEAVLIFDDDTARLIEVDFRGSAEDVRRRLGAEESPVVEAEGSKRAGRPRLGVVGREVTLLPRHWDWLSDQPGGASVALRKLVEEARRANEGLDRTRRAKDAAYRFMAAMTGDRPGFEEASRALFAADADRFHDLIAKWPADLRSHAAKLASGAF